MAHALYENKNPLSTLGRAIGGRDIDCSSRVSQLPHGLGHYRVHSLNKYRQTAKKPRKAQEWSVTLSSSDSICEIFAQLV
jgi:hypothetical protein